MKWMIMYLGVTLLTGCCKDRIITQCPKPQDVPATITYRMDAPPQTTTGVGAPTGAVVMKMLTEDLLQCRDVEDQLRVILKGYE